MRNSRWPMVCAMALPVAFQAGAQTESSNGSPTAAEVLVKSLGIVTINSGQPTSLPTQIPTTIEGVAREQIEETVNATDSEDAIKYFPSLLVRKRYIGDYNHAVLSSRASGTGNSARSAVYADGILLSNYLGNGATYAPRWGLVTPEEIERVDVMYGPFSAAYPGNSVGAVVDYVTRMPTRFEGHAKANAFTQNFSLYNTNETYSGNQASASLGSRHGDWSWWVNLNHTDSAGQPLVFATKLVTATGGAGTTPVTGAVLTPNNYGVNNYILGTNTQYHTVQDHAKIKVAYDLSPTLRASYTLGYWANTSDGNPQTYLRDAAGNPVYYGNVKINGQNYNINGAFNASRESLAHVMHGLSVKSHTQGEWDGELAASLYDYGRDQLRATTLSTTSGLSGGAGTITDQNGTGWSTVAAKGTWRPQGMQGAHIVDFGFQQENYQLRILKSNIAGNWLTDGAGTLNSDVGGKTQTQSIYGQDTWRLAPRWKTVLGARVENWRASGGYTRLSGSTPVDYDSRNETFVSPKAALAYQWSGHTVLKGSVGRAVRMPTVQELYGATSNANLSFVNDPNLRPEKSVTTELSLERDLGHGLLRLTVFNEDVTDSLYSQLIPGSTTTSRVQNVDAINTKGVEVAYQGNDVLAKGLDFSGSITYADSRIVSNPALPSSIGKYQPRVPVWRATALTTYRFDEQLSASLGIRYSGDQYSQLDNADVNGFAYMGASRYLIVDLRTRYRISRKAVAAFGIDNLTNEAYWNFHPYPKRTYVAELKYDF
ncbi:MAG: TonB-dependent receptor [Curvibacter sp. GWA2_64_110]|nr:MAG: TonB-dependent receptor [Curvibacter sp. GWA2_64_110]HCY16634.1 TonB-dependent receptor [Curvibacter sp.]